MPDNIKLDDLGEERIIKHLARKFSIDNPRVTTAIGDDTSVSTQMGSMSLLATTDTLTEGVHFRQELTTPKLLGGKALSISLSDIAAMGGWPLFLLVSLSLPPRTEKRFLDRLYSGIRSRAEQYGVGLAGGNLSKSKYISITTTVLGEAPKSDVVYRKGARAGDIIYVTGEPGASALGLAELERAGLAKARRGPLRACVLRHLDPDPRLGAGRALAKKRLATAMIDISDGLLLDLKRLCAQSGIGAIIEIEQLPLSAGLARCRKRGGNWASLALSGGEDYELLFTAREKDGRAIERLSRRLALRMTAIGRITKGRKVVSLGPDGRAMVLKKEGFLHF
ncbi:MAG: thiamine-phosphate kinase [Thermodesulfobacteriota bacterium]|nr:MAG: thiamine-phosphate kinase [Thermodesulfobacteriota bacterium]